MSRRLPKRVRITEAHDSFQVGEEYEVNGHILAGGYEFHEPLAVEEMPLQLIYGHKSEVIEYHESA